MQVLYTYSVENIVRNDLQCLHDRSVLVVLTTRTSLLSDCLSHHTIFSLPKTKTAQEIKNQFFATDKGRQLIGTVCGCRVEQTTDNRQRTTDNRLQTPLEFLNFLIIGSFMGHSSQSSVFRVCRLLVPNSPDGYMGILSWNDTFGMCIASPNGCESVS